MAGEPDIIEKCKKGHKAGAKKFKVHLDGFRSASAFGLGDSILVPAVIGWHSGNWHTNLALSLFAPTGQYDQNQAINLSKNF
jgi:hypothetical protein